MGLDFTPANAELSTFKIQPLIPGVHFWAGWAQPSSRPIGQGRVNDQTTDGWGP